MTFTQWFLFFIAIQVIHFLGTWKLYVKAGRKAWEAIIPIYNGIVLMQIINRPKWWVLLLFVPVVNLLMFLVIWIETIRTFGFYRKVDSLLVIATLGGYIFYIIMQPKQSTMQKEASNHVLNWANGLARLHLQLLLLP